MIDPKRLIEDSNKKDSEDPEFNLALDNFIKQANESGWQITRNEYITTRTQGMIRMFNMYTPHF
jgi:hypothetical protein